MFSTGGRRDDDMGNLFPAINQRDFQLLIFDSLTCWHFDRHLQPPRAAAELYIVVLSITIIMAIVSSDNECCYNISANKQLCACVNLANLAMPSPICRRFLTQEGKPKIFHALDKVSMSFVTLPSSGSVVLIPFYGSSIVGVIIFAQRSSSLAAVSL